MARVQGPLFGEGASGPLAGVLDYTRDGNVRHELHTAPPLTPGVAQSRIIVKAINPIAKLVQPARRADLQSLATDPQNWASVLTSHTIGSGRANWAWDTAGWIVLDAGQQATWNTIATDLRLRNVSIEDTTHNTHTITNGEALFHVARGAHRCNLPDQPNQPDGTNALAWALWLFNYVPPIPDGALMFDDTALSINDHILTF